MVKAGQQVQEAINAYSLFSKFILILHCFFLAHDLSGGQGGDESQGEWRGDCVCERWGGGGNTSLHP